MSCHVYSHCVSGIVSRLTGVVRCGGTRQALRFLNDGVIGVAQLCSDTRRLEKVVV